MTRQEIEDEIVAIIRSEKTLADGALTPDTPLAEAGIDSLDALNILYGVEEKFGISVPDDKAREIRTLSDMVRAVEELLPS